MGMFDSVIIDRLFCIHCGAALENQIWQTKDTECLLDTFSSLDEMFDKYYTVGYFDLISDCINCNEFIRIQLHNTSPKYQENYEKLAKQQKLEWMKEALPRHPYHKGHPMDFVWCPKCVKRVEDEESV